MSAYVPIIFLAMSALIAIANLCIFIETWLRRRRGILFQYSSIPFASLACGCVVWVKGGGTYGSWAFVPAVLDPGTWAIPLMFWRWWAAKSSSPAKAKLEKPKNLWKKSPPPQ